MSRLDNCIEAVNKKLTEYNLYREQQKEAEEKAEQALGRIKDYDACITIIQNIASTLQNNVKGKIVSIVQKALDVVASDITFDMEFVTRRDKTECDLFCTDKTGNRQELMFSRGGGILDIISFALRVAVWSLDNKASSVILLDECFKFLSQEWRETGATLFKTLSEELGIQFVVVSHIPEIVEVADTGFRIQKNSFGVSEISLLTSIKS